MNKPLSCVADSSEEQWWLDRHRAKLKEKAALGNFADLVMLGDSIMHEWEGFGAPALERYFANSKILNLGFAGDRTEHLIWRIDNGEIDNLSAEYAVLLIGTNNAGHRHDLPADIAQGISIIVEKLRSKLPTCKIILMAIFPRSRNSKKRMRKKVDQTNEIIKHFADNKSIYWLDINARFLSDGDILDESVMPDLLHPNAEQYEIWAQELKTFITTLTP